MPRTKVGICNLALREIGAAPITALDASDTSQESQVCQDIFDSLLEEVLAEHKWDFAKKWVALAEDANYTFVDDIYEYAYEMPANWIRFSRCEDRDTQFEMRGRTIVSNTEDMEIEYIQQMDDPATYPMFFIKALAARLKPAIAASIRTRFRAADLLALYYNEELPRAKASDAKQGSPSEADAIRHTESTDSWLTAR